MFIKCSYRCAQLIGALLVTIVAVGTGFAQTGTSVGRLTVGKAHGVSSTNLGKLAPAAAAAEALDRLDLSKDADGEARRRKMMDSFVADRTNRVRVAAIMAPLALPTVPGLPIAENHRNARGFPGISNLTQANVNFGFSVEPPY